MRSFFFHHGGAILMIEAQRRSEIEVGALVEELLQTAGAVELLDANVMPNFPPLDLPVLDRISRKDLEPLTSLEPPDLSEWLADVWPPVQRSAPREDTSFCRELRRHGGPGKKGRRCDRHGAGRGDHYARRMMQRR